ncbi:MAG: hypothetical protein KF726_14145 [Anaerolineae bacterium]|nr:hypothetical protein [Anaerolineae bacterium]
MSSTDYERITTLMQQVAELQRKVDFLMKHLNINYEDNPPDLELGIRPQIEELIRTGKKMEAIKLYQVELRTGLREAKDAVEVIEKEMFGQR